MRDVRWVTMAFAIGAVQVFLPQVWSPLGAVDWLLIAVVHAALRFTFQRSLILAAIAGLIQDGLGGGIIGLHAFAKTAVAALYASFGSLVVVRGPIPQAILTGAAAFMEGLIVSGWLLLLDRAASMDALDVPLRAVATGVATGLVFIIGRHWQRRWQRRQAGGKRGVRRVKR